MSTSSSSQLFVDESSPDEAIVTAFEQVRDQHPDICSRLCNKWVTADAWVFCISTKIIFPPQILCIQNFNRAIGNCPDYKQNSSTSGSTGLTSGSGVYSFNFLQEWFYYVVDENLLASSKSTEDDDDEVQIFIEVKYPNPTDSWVNKLIRSERDLLCGLQPLRPSRDQQVSSGHPNRLKRQQQKQQEQQNQQQRGGRQNEQERSTILLQQQQQRHRPKKRPKMTVTINEVPIPDPSSSSPPSQPNKPPPNMEESTNSNSLTTTTKQPQSSSLPVATKAATGNSADGIGDKEEDKGEDGKVAVEGGGGITKRSEEIEENDLPTPPTQPPPPLLPTASGTSSDGEKLQPVQKASISVATTNDNGGEEENDVAAEASSICDGKLSPSASLSLDEEDMDGEDEDSNDPEVIALRKEISELELQLKSKSISKSKRRTKGNLKSSSTTEATSVTEDISEAHHIAEEAKEDLGEARRMTNEKATAEQEDSRNHLAEDEEEEAICRKVEEEERKRKSAELEPKRTSEDEKHLVEANRLTENRLAKETAKLQAEQEEATRVAREKARIKAAQEEATRVAKELRIAEEIVRTKEKARLKAQEEARIAREERLAEEKARIARDKAIEEARLRAEEEARRIAEEKEAEEARIAEAQAKAAEEAVTKAIEEARRAEAQAQAAKLAAARAIEEARSAGEQARLKATPQKAASVGNDTMKTGSQRKSKSRSSLSTPDGGADGAMSTDSEVDDRAKHHPASTAIPSAKTVQGTPSRKLTPSTPKPKSTLGTPAVTTRTSSIQRKNYETPLSVRTLCSTGSLNSLDLVGSPLSLSSLATTAATPIIDTRAASMTCQTPEHSIDRPSSRKLHFAMSQTTSTRKRKSKSRLPTNSSQREILDVAGNTGAEAASSDSFLPFSPTASTPAKDSEAPLFQEALDNSFAAEDPTATTGITSQRESVHPTQLRLSSLENAGPSFAAAGSPRFINHGDESLQLGDKSKKRTKGTGEESVNKRVARVESLLPSDLPPPQASRRTNTSTSSATIPVSAMLQLYPKSVQDFDYFESAEAKQLFSHPEEEENPRDILQRRIELLRQANSTPDGWRYVIAGGAFYNRYNEAQIQKLRQQSLYLCKAYMIALDEMNGIKGFLKCCEDAVNALKGLGLICENFKTNTCVRKVAKWNIEFRTDGGFKHPNPAEHLEETPLLKNHPRIREGLIDYCNRNIDSLTTVGIIQYLENGPVKEAYEEFAREEAVTEQAKVDRLKSRRGKKPAKPYQKKVTSMNEWLAKFHIKTFRQDYVKRWLSLYGFKYNKQTKSWYKERNNRYAGGGAGNQNQDTAIGKESSASLTVRNDDEHAKKVDLPGAALAEPKILRQYPSIKHALLDYCRENFKTMTRKSLFDHLKDGAIMDAYKCSIRNEKDYERSKGQAVSMKNDRTPTLNEWLRRFGYKSLTRNTVHKWALVYGLRQDEMTGVFYFVGEESEQEVLVKRAKFHALFGPKDVAASSDSSSDDHYDSGSEASVNDSDGEDDETKNINGASKADMDDDQQKRTQGTEITVSHPRPPPRNYHPLHSPIQQVNTLPPAPTIVHHGPGTVAYHDWAYAQHYHYVNPAYAYRPYAYIYREPEAPNLESEHSKSAPKSDQPDDGMI